MSETNYIVNYGVDSRHLFENKSFSLLRDSKVFITSIPGVFKAYNLVKVIDRGAFNPVDIKIIKELIV
jgi:hypothetical protein|tara:strand:- start:364 stop:567 length:204 start_codon:yes stop_codon:yes gene_type:complete